MTNTINATNTTVSEWRPGLPPDIYDWRDLCWIQLTNGAIQRVSAADARNLYGKEIVAYQLIKKPTPYIPPPALVEKPVDDLSDTPYSNTLRMKKFSIFQEAEERTIALGEPGVSWQDPIIQAFLKDNDVQQLEISSSSIGWVLSLTKIYKITTRTQLLEKLKKSKQTNLSTIADFDAGVGYRPTTGEDAVDSKCEVRNSLTEDWQPGYLQRYYANRTHPYEVRMRGYTATWKYARTKLNEV